MGAKKQWTGKEKLAIMLSGLKSDCSVSALCNDHGITRDMYYKWRDQLLSDDAKLFERGGVDHARERLEHENHKLQETIGELTVELKKTMGKAAWREQFGEPGIIQQLKAKHPYWGLSSYLSISQI